MDTRSSKSIRAEWRPACEPTDDLVMSVRFADRGDLGRFAAKLDAPKVLRVGTGVGAMAVTTPNAILRWRPEEALPAADGEWTAAPTHRGDAAVAIDMLEAFLAWTRSRGLIDEAKSRRISRAVQMELAGAADGRPG